MWFYQYFISEKVLSRYAKIAKIGDKIVTFVAAILILVMLVFGGYSLWDMWNTAHGAFISNDLLKYKPKAEDPSNPTLHELYEINNDVLGWITIDDTHIDYPVVQGENDNIYLNRDVFGTFSLAGSIFLSCQNAREITDNYNIIYGHHVQGGAMFADVIQFQDRAFFEAHRRGRLALLDENYTIEVFACAPVDAYDETIYIDPRSSNDPTVYATVLGHIRNISVVYDESVQVGTTDKIVALSTCTTAATNGRVVLFGKLVREQN